MMFLFSQLIVGTVQDYSNALPDVKSIFATLLSKHVEGTKLGLSWDW